MLEIRGSSCLFPRTTTGLALVRPAAAACAALVAVAALAQTTPSQNMWSEATAREGRHLAAAGADQSRLYQVDAARFDAALQSAPLEFSRGQAAQAQVWLPMPDGSYELFGVMESPIMQPGLASRYPAIKTYSLTGLTNPRLAGRLDRNHRAMHALVKTGEGMVQVNPDGGIGHPFYRSVVERASAEDWFCGSEEAFTPALQRPAKPGLQALAAAAGPVANYALPSGDNLRVYRLAVATTGEYYAGRGGNDDDVLASIVTVINRVTLIYESEVAIRFVLISNTDDLFFTDPNTDGYTNTVPCTMRNENTPIINATIDVGDYDIGHVFGTSPGGGCAGGSVVCDDNNKGNGASGLRVDLAPDQESFSGYRLVTHEIGHQFSAGHTWSGTGAPNCTIANGQFSAADAYEPLGGTTIMSYSGTCGPDDIQNTAVDTYFHTHSFEQIVTFSALGAGDACALKVGTGNSIPVVDAGPDYTIPRQTPFTLTGSANDADDPILSYAWEQYDLSPGQISPLVDVGNNPLFRSFPPVFGDPSRTFPQISDILNGTTTLGEILPTTDRTMTFRLTARDNRPAGGAADYDTMTVTVDGDPFQITSPNGGAAFAGCTLPVTWQVGGGDVAANVNLLLSTDGGLSFPMVLAANTPNDGAEDVSVPCVDALGARIRAEAADNIFFDISSGVNIYQNAPEIEVSATGGEVDDACQFEVPFAATITDDCSINAANVQVEVTELTGNGALGAPVVNIVQQDPATVSVSGTVMVSGLTDSPAIVRVTVTATDGCGQQTVQTADADVIDTTPPTIGVSLSPQFIWSPDHKMRNITATVEVQDNCPVTSFQLVSVTSSEPDDTTGDGKFINDIQGADIGTADLSFLVRAERMGSGPGRLYTATYKAADGSGNEAADSANVLVPNSQK
jgi:hypothetical protein